MKWLKLLVLLGVMATSSAQAENMIMLRVDHSFDNAMILLKEKLNEYGYKVAHIQTCDTGLSDFGYKTDFYKSIFFGKFEEMRQLTSAYPDIIPYVPLKLAVMQEKDTVVMVALNPQTLSEFFPEQALKIQFSRWESDIRAIFDEVANTGKL